MSEMDFSILLESESDFMCKHTWDLTPVFLLWTCEGKSIEKHINVWNVYTVIFKGGMLHIGAECAIVQIFVRLTSWLMGRSERRPRGSWFWRTELCSAN